MPQDQIPKGLSGPSLDECQILFTNAPMGVFTSTPEGRILSANPAMAKMFGYDSPEEFIEIVTDIAEQLYVNPADRKEFMRIMEKHGEVTNYECQCRRLDGTIIWISLNAWGLQDNNGKIVHHQEIFTDITDRKQAEADLLHQKAHFESIFTNTNDAMVFFDTEHCIVNVNDMFTKMFGYTLDEVRGKNINTVVDPHNQAHEHGSPRILQGEQTEIDTVRYTKCGEPRNVLLKGGPVREQDEIVGGYAIYADITDRKRSEDALRQSENYYRAIFEISGSAMLIVEEDETISLVNSNFEELSGYSKHEIEEKISWPVFVHSDDVPQMKEIQNLRQRNPDAAPRQYEIRFITRLEDERNLLLSVDIIPGTSRIIASGIDITERKQMEEKLKEMSIYDSLTNLYSRNFFEEEMKRLSDGRHNPLGIIVCDLDGLKFLNDTLGHQAGDQMLIQAADILKQNFRSSDIIARIGGDEFAVLLSETNPKVMEQMLQRLRQSVQDYNSNELKVPLSLSMGYALDEGTAVDMHDLFREADNRMYREKLQREGSAQSAILQALTVSMEARDFNTENHCDHLQELTASLTRSLTLSQDFVNDLSLLARFHDLGKVGIPDHILFKPGGLTKEELQQMHQHCEIGHRIASSVPDLEPIADYILKHHEWWDGRGYPLGLSGEDIPLPCRILAIADAYDAMTSDRPYRKAMTREEAIAELRRCAGTQFDPELVKKFIKILEEADGG